MSGILRLYDTHFYDLMRGMHAFQSDTVKVALLNDTYTPCAVYGTRAGLVGYATGDVVFSALYNCFFVAAQGGTTDLGVPAFDSQVGAATLDGTVVWVSAGLAPPSAHAAFADVSPAEVAGAGYASGGVSVAVTLTLENREARLALPTVEWSPVTVTAKYAVIYKLGTANGVVNPVIAYILLDTLGANKSSVDGIFKIEFGSSVAYILGGWTYCA